jgi:hypothetical protein
MDADTLPLDVKVKVEAATQLRDNLEHYISGPIYPAFLKKLIPIFINCLKGPPVFVSTSAEQVRFPFLGFGGVLTVARNCEIVYSRSSIDCPRILPSPLSHMRRKS